MSRALAVFHGRFGRATVYQLNRPFNVHAHREGHLIFQVGGTPGEIGVGEETHRSTRTPWSPSIPWEPHNFLPTDVDDGALFFVLYVNADWFAPDASRPVVSAAAISSARRRSTRNVRRGGGAWSAARPR